MRITETQTIPETVIDNMKFSLFPRTRHHTKNEPNTQNQPQMGFFNFNHQVCRSSLLSARKSSQKKFKKTQNAKKLKPHQVE